MPDDPFNLARFAAAQADIYDQALQQIRAGRKTDHWMWFIFPQLTGLGMSAMSRHYGINGIDEAGAYLAIPCWAAESANAPKPSMGWRVERPKPYSAPWTP